MSTSHQLHGSAGLLASVALTAILSGCSNSSNPSNGSLSPNHQIVTHGTVTASNTLSVNGRHISISGAAVYADSQIVDQSVLKSGMTVILQRQNGVAKEIHYQVDVKGPVDAVDTNGNLVIMGQTVLISSGTSFDDSGTGAISVGEIVEVSGLRDNFGVLHASFVEQKQSQPNAYELQGPISQLNKADRTFVIGELLVNYKNARLDDISATTLQDGQYIVVKDEIRSYEPGSLFLSATKLKQHRDVLSVSENDSTPSYSPFTEVEIESFVTRIISDDVFELGSTTVVVSPDTRFRDGDRSQLQLNSRVEVEGWLNINGELEAWEVEFEDGSDYYDSDDDDSGQSSASNANGYDETVVELQGVVSQVDADAGLLTIIGIDILVGSRTEFENGQDQYITRSQFFNLIDAGRTVVKVKWKFFNSYTDVPDEVEIEI